MLYDTDFSCLMSLLTDSSLMQPENLIFKNNKTYPAWVEKGAPGRVGEIHTREAYQNYIQKILNKDQTVIFPLIIFGDGTVVDGAMRKPMEPFSFTLGIFWQHVRTKSLAWHVLCYIKNNPYNLFSLEEIVEGNMHHQQQEKINLIQNTFLEIEEIIIVS